MATTNLPRFTVTNAADLATVGLPSYLLGTWEHYTTNLGEARFGRVAGKGRKFISLPVDIFAKMVDAGLMVAA